MTTIKRFEEIRAWQRARALTIAIHAMTATGVFRAHPSLKSQLCRASISTMANIAEGFSRRTERDFAHFLDIAKGSAIEVQSLLYIALDLKCISEQSFRENYEIADECAAMVTGLARY